MNVEIVSNKQKLLEIMASLTKTGEQGSLSKPSPAFLAAQSYLGKSDFYVSVCGEIKQGKSSFINSLLGRDLLPTDVDVATSQVFRVSSSEDGSDDCHLVFEDGTRTEIGIDELDRYGKERGANLLRDPKVNGRSLAYIDVQVSAGFLPPGVHLLDTPGLGAVNPQHEAIANNAIERSDAVIFVSDVSRPLTAPELSILARIYKRTPNIILVQTKTDLLDEGKIRAVIETNKQKVKDVLGGEKTTDLIFCPYSAVLVREGAKIKDVNSSDRKTLLEEGHGLELLDQLQKLFFKTVGVYALSTAYSEAVGYFGLLLGELRKRKVELTASSEERAKLKEEAENALAEFKPKFQTTG